MNPSLAWEERFPKGYGHTSISYLKRRPGFEDAKKGDLDAARFVVLSCVKQERICAFQRLLQNPIFTGFIQRDTAYILVDDVITQGGTIAALRKFVIAQGGKVVAVVALAYAIGSHTIAPKRWNIVMLLVKFGTRLLLFLQILGIAATFEELTNMQAKYLLRFASVQNMVKKMAAA